MKCAIPSTKKCGNRRCKANITKNDTNLVEIPIESYDSTTGLFTIEWQNVLLCRHCMARTRKCTGCNRLTLLCDVINLGNGYQPNNRYCAECNNTSMIFDAGVKNRVSYFGEKGRCRKKQGHLYMGVELEVTVNRNLAIGKVATSIQESLGDFAFLKWDGSVQNGFEIVSQPASIEYHRKGWDSMFKLNANNNLLETVNLACGMHVHIGRKSLTEGRHEKALERLKYLICSEKNRGFMEAVSGRGGNGYCRYDVGDDKYRALNLSPRTTIEFRMFQSHVEREVFLKNLEFVKAMVDYCSFNELMPKGSSKYEEFCKFVNVNETFYPLLHKFLVNHNFITNKLGAPRFAWIMEGEHMLIKANKD